MSRRAKIVCTLGPATASPGRIGALVDAGMDVARLNFSHGSHEDHAALHAGVRAAAEAAGRAVAVLADLQGPKIRLGRFAGGRARLEPGAEFTLTTRPITGDARGASTDYEALAREVSPGNTVLLDDGRVKLEALASDGVAVRCRVVEGGEVSDHKGINLPGVRIGAPALTPKDLDDLAFALGLGVDLVALSFVRAPDDARAVREAMERAGASAPVIAKLERPEAVERLEAIVEAFDGLMVARGDLGVEMPLELVPLVQKRAVQTARERSRPVIVATQMLESMVHAARPTRAEASDVANAVLDGADALMLSAETGIGEHPVESVTTMARLIAAAETRGGLPPVTLAPGAATLPEVLAAAAVQAADDLSATALVAFTQSGATARLVARHRDATPLLAFTPDPAVRRRLALSWGVEAFVVPTVSRTDDLVDRVNHAMLELGRGRSGDLVVIVAGTPPGVPGSTNMLRVQRLQG